MTHLIDGVVDIERDRLRRLGEARAELVDEREAHARDGLAAGCVLEAADGRLRGERDARIGRAVHSDLHQGIVPQSAQIVAVLPRVRLRRPEDRLRRRRSRRSACARD
jgi:hypothetical protein